MKAANSRAVLKFSNLLTSARTAVAVPSPIPGTLISNSNFSFKSGSARIISFILFSTSLISFSKSLARFFHKSATNFGNVS